MRRSMPVALIVLALVASGSLLWVRSAEADLREATIDPTATRAFGGSFALVTGSATCTNGDSFQIVVTMGQSAAGAQAQGEAVGGCTGEPID